jgi:uncharacterized protein YndB with AHSA1/START domain
MNSIKEKVLVRAPVAKVFEAITRPAGYRGWWSRNSEIAESVGGRSTLNFVKDGTPVRMQFRVDEITPAKTVRWTCVEHDMAPWIGTTLRWDVLADGERTEVVFEHAGWQGDAPEPVVQGWRHFVTSLRSYLETGKGEPW